MYQKHVTPLPASTSLHLFSQEIAMAHILQLAGNIRDRQQSTRGLHQAFEYVESELRNLQSKASSRELRVEIDESFANGSFNMVFLGHSISNTYQNHRNLAVRVSALEAQEGAQLMKLEQTWHTQSKGVQTMSLLLMTLRGEEY
jgi:hypothetical protein